MSGSGQRENVFPTRMNLYVSEDITWLFQARSRELASDCRTLTKSRLKGAQTGHSLLKKKSDALTKRFRIILGKIDEVCAPRSRARVAARC